MATPLAFSEQDPTPDELVARLEYDTVYHEHLSYFLLRPLLRSASAHGLAPAYVRRIPVHGGGLRVYLARGKQPEAYPDSVRAVLDFERDAGLYERQPYLRFAREIDSIRRDVRSTLARLCREGKRIAAYGASAKGAVLLNSVDADASIVSFIVDDTPEKQGLLAPGTGIPIVSAERLRSERPDYLLILAWNFIDEILQRTTEYREAGGRYIVPVPALLAVIVGEVARIRSALYWVPAGGLAIAAAPFLLRLSSPATTGALPSTALLQLLATAGFAAGLVYWLLAGRLLRDDRR